VAVFFAMAGVCAGVCAGLCACGETRGLILGELSGDGSAFEAAFPDAAETDGGVHPEGGCAGCSYTIVLDGASSTAVQGGSTGTAFTDTCPGNQAVIGYQGFLTGPNVSILLVGGIQTLCGDLSLAGASGPVTTSAGDTLPMRGASQNSPWTQTCPANEVVVGFSGRSGSDLDQIAFVCAAWSAKPSGSGEAMTMGATDTLTSVGGDGGTPYQHACPPGELARGSTGGSGLWVDSFGLVCGTPSIVIDGGP
jgi:hypothetical protein